MNFSETIKEWISIYAPTIGKGRNPKKTPYEILNNGNIDFPEGFNLNYSGNDHPGYKRNFKQFPACIKINTCGNFFNIRGGAFLNSTTGFPKNITAVDNIFKFTISSVDCNIDYFLSCLNLVKKWIVNNPDINVEFKIEVGSILFSKYFTVLFNLSNNNIDDIDEVRFVSKIFGMIDVVEDEKLRNLLEHSCKIYFQNRHSDVKQEYGIERKGRQKDIDDKKFDIKKSSKYFPIIDVLKEVQKNNTLDGIIKIQTGLQKKKFQKDCKFYAAKLYKDFPAYKMFNNHGLNDIKPDEWVNFISSVEFQSELAEDPKGANINIAMSREARQAVKRDKNIKKGKKTLNDLGLYYSTDENTLRASDLNKMWVVQHIDTTYIDPENPNRKKLIDPVFIELRNTGVFNINDYETDLKYFYANLIGMSADILINTRVRKYETYDKSPEYVLEDGRSTNSGDVRYLLGKNR